MLIDGAQAFWLGFISLLAYECVDKHNAFVLPLARERDGWRCRFPTAAARIREGYLQFYGPLDWLRVETCVNWFRVQQGGLTEGEASDAGGSKLALAADMFDLHTLRLPVTALAICLLVVLPMSSWLLAASNWLLLVIGLIYASAAWAGWCLLALGKACPFVTGPLRALALEILFCPLFGIGAVRKAGKLILSTSIVDYRDELAEGEWLRLIAWVDEQLQPLEAYWQDVGPATDSEESKGRWQTRLRAARGFYTEVGDAAR